MTLTSEQVTILDEPLLSFSGNQKAEDPHDGLALFGPFGRDTSSHPKTPAYILLGTPEGTALFGDWSRAVNRPAAVPEVKRHRLWPPYPGFEASFDSRWLERPAWSFTIDRAALLNAARKKDQHERCFAVVEMYLEGFLAAKKLDAAVAVAVCVVPDEVWLNCRPKSRVANPTDSGLSISAKRSRKAGQFELFDRYNPDQYQLSPDFRRQLKARTMRFDIPLQIVRESTLRLTDDKAPGMRDLTPLSDRMWNLATALYYKSGGKPWKLSTAREGVCYVGLAFRRTEGQGRTACCAAQMFLDSGDGIVFLGEYGPWYSPEDRQFHLSRQAASSLLSGVLQTYQSLHGKPLTEIFLHCRSTISDDEFAGYSEACPQRCKIVGVRVRRDRFGARLYRVGKMPVTFLRESATGGLLYAAGFKPRLATYDGWETPAPLRIDVQHGEANINTVAMDILGLTKLNYNACHLGESQPVTVKFSDAVGEILVSNPTVKDLRPNFKYYI